MDMAFLQMVGIFAVGAGAYAAVRADLSRINEVAKNAATSAASAHTRLDFFTRDK